MNARAICTGCGRPPITCICAQLVTVQPRTKVVVLQHPCEADNPIGTAWMVERCLSAQRIVGVELEDNRAFIEATSDPNAILLAPGPSAIDLHKDPPKGPVTLIVIDGTWPQARKLLRVNPTLAKLPRYAFQPASPSRYRIRREPAAHCVSTIEATVAALECLEPIDGQSVLAGFDAMVEHQVRIAGEQMNNRHLRSALARREKAPRAPRLPPLGETSLVVAYGEANAWPRGSEHGPHPELVHFVAERLATPTSGGERSEAGERFESFIAPSHPLSPGFPLHTGIPPARVLAGESRESFHARFAAFLREDDRLAVWGTYVLNLLRAEGLAFSDAIDLRFTATRFFNKRAGDAAELATTIGAANEPSWAMYRTGLRHAAAKAVARSLSRARA